jgi:GAF domain-containing protein
MRKESPLIQHQDTVNKSALAQSLLHALDSTSEGFALFDANDRLVAYNYKYVKMQGQKTDEITVGMTFEAITRAAAEQGHYMNAIGQIEEWVEERVSRYRAPQGSFEEQLSNGLWLQISELKTEDGGTFSICRNITEQKAVETTLRRQNEYLETLHKTAVELISHLDLNVLLEDILTRAAQLLGTEHSYIYLVDSVVKEVKLKVGIGIFSERVGSKLEPNEGLTGKVWQSGTPLVVNNVSNWPGRSNKVSYAKIGSLAGVPLLSKGKVIGVLGMAHLLDSEKFFGNDELTVLSRFAQLASLALDNAQLYSTAQQEKQRSDELLNVVIPIGVALSAEQNFDRLLEKILIEAKSFCNADAGTLYLRTDDNKLKFEIVRNGSLNIAMGGTSNQPINFPPVVLVDENGDPNHSNVAAHVALTGESINIPDAYQAEGFNFSGTKTFDENTGYRSTSFLTVPLKNAHDRVVGVLQLINALHPHTGRVIPFDRSLEQIVSSLSSLATVALEAYIREQNLRQQIQQLRIEIDEVKRQKQVSEIIDTDFFQDLKQKARRMRSRSNRFAKSD